MADPKWLLTPAPNPRARLRLFCFPYAGAGSAMAQSWASGVPREIEICTVHLPGRETRYREDLHTNAQLVVEAMMEAFVDRLDLPFAFFGHSLGALLAFICARELRRRRYPLPLHLFVSGRSAPQALPRKEPFYLLPEQLLIEKLRLIGGTDSRLFDDRELMQILLPIIRADFRMNEAYVYGHEPALSCPISAFRGAQDELTPYDAVLAWREQTSSTFQLRTLPGGHFFIHDATFRQIFSYDLTQLLLYIRVGAAGPAIGA